MEIEQLPFLGKPYQNISMYAQYSNELVHHVALMQKCVKTCERELHDGIGEKYFNAITES
jgi:hypothetical protein